MRRILPQYLLSNFHGRRRSERDISSASVQRRPSSSCRPVLLMVKLKSPSPWGVPRTMCHGASDEVWLAVGPGGRKRACDPRVRKLCRLLGFGLLGISSAGAIEVLVAPRPGTRRQDKKRVDRLIDEHRRRIGDPAPGGSTRQPIMTAYRQQALACAASLAEGPRRTSELRSLVPNAPSILFGTGMGGSRGLSVAFID